MNQRDRLANYLREEDDPWVSWEHATEEVRNFWRKHADFLMKHMGWEYDDQA